MNNSKTNLEILIDILSTNYIQIEEPLEEYIREFASYLSEIESRKNDKDNWLAAQNIIAKQALLGHYNNSEEKYPSNMTNEIEFIIENSDFVQILNSSNPILISEEKNSELQAKCKAINLTYVTGYQALKLLDAEDTRYHSGKSKKHLVKIIDTTITKTVTKHDLYKKIKNYLTNKKRILFVLNESNEK